MNGIMQLIVKNKFDDFRQVSSDAGSLVKKYEQIKNIFNENSIIFAVPKFDDNHIEWLTKLKGIIVQYVQCDDEQKHNIKVMLKKQLDGLYSATIVREDEDYYEYLEKIIEIPNYDNIYLIENRVVITNWGYIEDSYNAPRQIIKKLIENISAVEPIEASESAKLDPLAIEQKDLQGKQGDPRINLSWNNENDLDLYVIDPCDNQIDFKNKEHICNGSLGILDLDANVSEDDIKENPQENIVWETGGSQGQYKVLIKDAKNRTGNPTPFKLTIINNGEISKHTGVVGISEFKKIVDFFH